nr:hypothetical protein [Tanacetum cinerariifolium]
MPYTSHPPMGLLEIASVASLVSDVLVKKASRNVSTTGMRKADRGKGITKDTDKSPFKLVKATMEVHPNPDAPIIFDYGINRVMYQLTNEEIQDHLEKRVQMEKAAQEAKPIELNKLELNKPELIKVVEEVASKAGVDLKDLRNMKGGKEFLNKHDAEYKFIQREHMEKLKKSRELKKKRFDHMY